MQMARDDVEGRERWRDGETETETATEIWGMPIVSENVMFLAASALEETLP